MVEIRIKAVWGDFHFGQCGAAGTRFIFPSDTIYKTDKLYEAIALKTLDIRQQSIAIPERHEIKVSSVIDVAYCLEIVSIFTHDWQNTHSSLVNTDHVPK